MVRIICTILLALSISSCSLFQKEKEVIVIKPVNVPVYVCPKKLKEVEIPAQPQLYIYLLTTEDKEDPGKVAKFYKLSVKQLLQYSENLVEVVGLHKDVCDLPPIE